MYNVLIRSVKIKEEMTMTGYNVDKCGFVTGFNVKETLLGMLVFKWEGWSKF